MKTSIFLIAILLSTISAQSPSNGGQDLINCVKDCTDAVNEITTYIVKEEWFNLEIIARVAYDITKAVEDCSKVKSLNVEEIDDWKFSQECKDKVTELVNSLKKMKTLIAQMRFKEFTQEFKGFKLLLEAVKTTCA